MHFMHPTKASQSTAFYAVRLNGSLEHLPVLQRPATVQPTMNWLRPVPIQSKRALTSDVIDHNQDERSESIKSQFAGSVTSLSETGSLNGDWRELFIFFSKLFRSSVAANVFQSTGRMTTNETSLNLSIYLASQRDFENIVCLLSRERERKNIVSHIWRFRNF